MLLNVRVSIVVHAPGLRHASARRLQQRAIVACSEFTRNEAIWTSTSGDNETRVRGERGLNGDGEAAAGGRRLLNIEFWACGESCT